MADFSSFTPSVPVKIKIPVGATLDIPTGNFIVGRKGETVLSGGLGTLTGIVGLPNVGKSLLAYYVILAATAKVHLFFKPNILTYETEMTLDHSRIHHLNANYAPLKETDLISSGSWIITDKSCHDAGEWYKTFRAFLTEQRNLPKKLQVHTPFMTLQDEPITMKPPSFCVIDSLSEFETVSADEAKEEHEIGSSKLNMMYARQGQAKKQFISDLPPLCIRANTYLVFTAHVGENVNYDNSPYAPKPLKKLNNLAVNKKIKGISENFLFLTADCWEVLSSEPFITKDSKEPEYPLYQGQGKDVSSDLQLMTISQLRGKGSGSSVILKLIYSQSTGMLPSLTEFHLLRTNGQYGLAGSAVNYVCVFYPSVKLSRTTVRLKLQEDRRLRRAIQIASELLQLGMYKRLLYNDLICEPEQLYQDLLEQGYDWQDLLLSVNFYGFDDYVVPLPHLSIIDLLKMRLKQYHPYWMDADKKILPEYLAAMPRFENF